MDFLTDKGCYGFSIFLGTYNEQLVTDVEFRVLVRDADMPFVTNAGAYERTSQEVFHLNQLFTVDSFITHFQMQHMRHVFHIGFLRIELLFFFFQIDAADITHGDNSADDTHYAERIGASISQCNRITCIVQLVQRFLGGTQTGSIGHGTVQNTYYHRKVYITVNEVNTQCDNDIQCHNAYGKHV